MEGSEKQPLLEKEAKDGKPIKVDRCPEMVESTKGWRKFSVLIVIGVMIVVCIAAISGTSAFAAKFTLYTKARQTEFTVYRHNIFCFACERAVIIQISYQVQCQQTTNYRK